MSSNGAERGCGLLDSLIYEHLLLNIIIESILADVAAVTILLVDDGQALGIATGGLVSFSL